MAGRLDLVTGDITTLDVDAIVNAANAQLAPGGGVCGAIHRAAGPGLARDCAESLRMRGPCPTGEARITPGHDLSAKWVIHAVGPVWQGGDAREPALLADAYRHSLRLAGERGLRSIAFPAISTGIFGYPLEAATRVAVATVSATLPTCPTLERVIFCAFDARTARVYETIMNGEGQPK